MSDGSQPAGVAAEDLQQAVRVHLDRVHDLVRRLGADAQAAVEVVETSAVDLVEVVAAQPEAVEDAVGWWVARARVLTRRVADRAADLPRGGGLLSSDSDQRVLAEGLERLPERDRIALLLRDSYDLPAVSTGAALGTDAGGAMALVAQARLVFLEVVDDEASPAVPSHQSDVAALARLGEGGSVAAADATARRHAMSCPACRAVTDAQQRAHLLLTGLTVIALPSSDRAAILDRTQELTYALLPTRDELAEYEHRLFEIEQEQDPRLLSPLLAVLGIVLAVLGGLGLGLLLSRGSGVDTLAGADGRLPAGVPLLSPSPARAASLPSPPEVSPGPPETRVFVIASPSPSPAPVPLPPPPSPEPQVEQLAINVDPGSGPNGTTMTIDGAGWTPGVEVTLTYLDPLGNDTGSSTGAVPDTGGRFTVALGAVDPTNTPGDHTVRASDGSQRTSATFTAEG